MRGLINLTILFLLAFSFENVQAEVDKISWGSGNLTFLKNHGEMWIKYYSKREQKLFERQLHLARRYERLVKSIFRSYGLPEDLFFVGLIESGYSATARSTSDAVGPWQFIKSTAQNYGLQVKSDLDERRNLIKSTKAAARYFADLYNIFGSWEIALCAYNRGEYGLIRAIRKASSRNYLVLIKKKLIPAETEQYISKIVAAKKIYENPGEYGFSFLPLEKDLQDEIMLARFHHPLSLKALASRLQIDTQDLQDLNPDLLSDRVTVTKGSVTLVIPKHAGAALQSVTTSQSAQVRKQNNHGSYRVKRGDTLRSIALELSVAMDDLININRLKKNGQLQALKVNQELIIPI